MNTPDNQSPAQDPEKSASAESPRNEENQRPEMLDKLEQGAHQTINHLADGAAAQIKHARATLSHAQERMQHKAGELRQVCNEWSECMRLTVREKPLTVIVTAFLLGVLAGRGRR